MEIHALHTATENTPAKALAGTGPFRFLFHYVRRHPIGHAVVLVSVLTAGLGVYGGLSGTVAP